MEYGYRLFDNYIALLKMAFKRSLLIIAQILSLIYIKNWRVEGHGRLLEPPMRASVWRFPEFEQYDPPVNYDDDSFWCGNMNTQYNLNGGKCGVCGDNWADPVPRSQEDGGIYGRGIIVRNYTAGQIIPITVELTGAHDGTFQYSVCPRNSRTDPETEECFKNHVLYLADGTGTKQPASKRTGIYKTKLKLPFSIKCTRCVLRWHYYTGNNWGLCENGTDAVGCGQQETFRGCADIGIY